MFGFREKKLVSAAICITLPLRKGLSIAQDPPETLWEDPYALGYLEETMTLAMGFAVRSLSFKLGPDWAAAKQKAFTAISQLDGVTIMRRAYQFQDQGNRDYL